MAQVENYRVLLEGAEGEIVEKKSRFIANVRKCESEEEAAAHIEEIRKKYWDARHHCYAYVIGKNAEIARYSDDGEPSGTAGRPILEVIQGEKIRNVLVIVTRYFGGTLLGTGGLVRAYTQAAREGIAKSVTGVMCYGAELMIETDYNSIGKILRLLEKNELEPAESIYTEIVTLRVLVAKNREESLCHSLVELTGGKVKIEKVSDLYFTV